MPDFSPSGIIDLPALTLDAFEKGPDPRLLSWLREAVQEGDRLNRTDPSFDQMDLGMAYVTGQHRKTTIGGSGGPSYLPGIQLNECGRAVEAHTSFLTDLQPVFAYKSMNPAFVQQADVLNKLTVAWWITTMADIELGNVIKYALAAGQGDLIVEWDPFMGFGGDCSISARDSRDTLSIRPALTSHDLQQAEGVILREGHSINAMRGLFPTYANKFRPTTDSLLSTLMGLAKRVARSVVSPAADTLAGLDQAQAAIGKYRANDVILYRTWLTDRSRNLTSKPIPVGPAGAAYSYVVQPGEPMYPFKRMILSTPEFILYDGPNTYWHGQFPVNRLRLRSVPWQRGGIPLLNDVIPMQDGINHNLQALLLGIEKWLNPAVKYNRGAVSETFMRLFDPRRPGNKVKMNMDGMKTGFEVIEGPNPQIISLALQTVQYLKQAIDDRTGTPNLQELLALRQSPGADTLQRYFEAMTPELRQEGRQIEAFLRPVAEQLKVNRFQFESNARRVAVLGDAGETLQDFDFDPGTLVPAMSVGDEGYQRDLDRALPRDVRARAFHKTIVFTIAPNSILAMNQTESKMMKFQLARMGMLDVWTLAEALDIPNYGAPPAIPLPPINPEQTAQEVQAALQQPNGLALLAGKYLLDPMSGQWLEVRQPVTIPERLMAQQTLGIGMAENPAGRKASGQDAPRMEQKSDGRTTVTESKHDAGPNSDNG